MSHLTLTEVGQDLDRIVTLDTSTPTTGDDDALVAIEAAPVNNADILFAAGWFGVYPAARDGPRHRPSARRTSRVSSVTRHQAAYQFGVRLQSMPPLQNQ